MGFPLNPSRQADPAAEMRSFEALTAYLCRLAQGSQPLHVLPIGSIPEGQYRAAMEILGRYDASSVLIDSYEKWALLPDKTKIELSDAMGSYRVYEKSTADRVGVVCPSTSIWCARYDAESIVRWHRAFENVCSEVLDRLPHRLSVRFDRDYGDVSGLAAQVVLDAQCMTDAEVGAASKLICPTVFVGDCGRYVGASREERHTTPLESLFGVVFHGSADYLDELRVDAGEIDVEPTTFALPLGMSAPTPSIGETDATSLIGGFEEAAPMKFSGRSSMFAFDPTDDDMAASVVGRMALYAVGRDA